MVLAVVSGLSTWMLATPTTSAASSRSQAMRPENGRIVFRRWLNDSHTRGDIFTINPDGTGLFRVTHTPNAASTEPSPSPDGHWIVYMVIPHGDLDHGRLFKIRPNGSGKTELGQTCRGDCQGDGFPDWSNTGLIAFQRDLSPSPSPSDHATRAEPSRRFTVRRRGTGLVPQREATGVRAVRQLDRPPGDLHRGTERHGASPDHPMAARRIPTAVLAARSMDRVPLS